MSLPAYDTIIIQYQEEITLLLNECVYKGYMALSDYLKTPLAISMVLYIAFTGISIMQGWVKLSIETFSKSALKIGLIYLFAMNWGNFSGIVIDGIQGAASNMSAVLVSATPIELPHFAGEGVTGALQSLLIEVAKVGNYLFQKGGITKLAPLFDGCFVWVSGILMITIAFLELVMAQIMMATLFTAGPLFIAFTLFQPTRVFFERWLGALCGCAFILIFVNITVAINMTILQSIISDQYLTKAISFPLVSFVPFYIVAVLAVLQLLRVSALAMSLGGSIGGSIVAQQASEMIAGTMFSSFGAMSGAFGSIKNPIKRHIGRFSRQGASQASDTEASGTSPILHMIQQNIRKGEPQ